jgi:hypothetical protein
MFETLLVHELSAIIRPIGNGHSIAWASASAWTVRQLHHKRAQIHRLNSPKAIERSYQLGSSALDFKSESGPFPDCTTRIIEGIRFQSGMVFGERFSGGNA